MSCGVHMVSGTCKYVYLCINVRMPYIYMVYVQGTCMYVCLCINVFIPYMGQFLPIVNSCTIIFNLLCLLNSKFYELKVSYM